MPISPLSSKPTPVRFGTIYLELPTDPNQVHPGVPQSDSGLVQATAVVNAFGIAARQGVFEPTHMDQFITLPHGRIKNHPYESPRGDNQFQRNDLRAAVRTQYDLSKQSLLVKIEEKQLPFDTLVKVLFTFLDATHKITAIPSFYAVGNTPLQKTYEYLIDYMGEMAFQQNQGRPGSMAHLLEEDSSGNPDAGESTPNHDGAFTAYRSNAMPFAPYNARFSEN
jgi:hypothetical protein